MIDDGRRHSLAGIQQRSHAVFLCGPVIGHRSGVASGLCQRLRGADERAGNLTHGPEVEPLQIRLHRRRPREGPDQPLRLNLDARIVRAHEQQLRFRA